MGKYVGIDLGTTFSAVAYIDSNGNPHIIENRDGKRITPSTVYFGEDIPLVGEAAKKKSSKDPGNYVELVKRHMGEKGFEVTLKNGQRLRPEVVSAQLLKSLKEMAEERLGDSITGAVITVPAYFADPQRNATRDAATIAGLNVLDIINEPTAAAIAFGIEKGVTERQKVLIYDFGGGTFDVSLLDIGENEIRVLATDGDHKLGGCDVDATIVKYIKEEAKKQGIDVESDAKAIQKIRFAAEKAKKELSSASSTTIEEIYIRNEEICVDIDRGTFNMLIDNIVNDTMCTVQSVVDDAGLEYEDLDKVLLVGGSTRIPRIREAIHEEVGIKPSSDVNPDEAVAIGAAFHAVEIANKIASGSITRESHESDEIIEVSVAEIPKLANNYSFKDVTSHSIGTVAISPTTNMPFNSIILERNSSIPAEASEEYTTLEPFQNALSVEVTQGEDEDLRFVTIIGEAELAIEPRDHCFAVRVTVGCDSQGIIHVHAFDIERNVNLGEISINRDENNMSLDEIENAKRQI